MNRIQKIFVKTLFVAAVPFTISAGVLAVSKTYAASDTVSVIQRTAQKAEKAVLEAYASEDPDVLKQEAEMPQNGIYDVMLDSVCGPITYFNQSDARWGGYLYGGRDPISTYGCGPTVMAMLATSFTGRLILPTETADWSAANKGWCPGGGSYHRLIPDCAAAYGLKAAPLKDYSLEGIKGALDSGYLVVALMNKGHFTQAGHFIILTRIAEDGKLWLIDPNNYDNTKYGWDPEIILQELNHRATNGGPLWMVRPPDSPQ